MRYAEIFPDKIFASDAVRIAPTPGFQKLRPCGQSNVTGQMNAFSNVVR
jgi:hypothetical protein